MHRLLLSICLILCAFPAWTSPAAANDAVPIPTPGKAMPDSDASVDSAFPGMDDLTARAQNGEPGAEEALGNRYEKGNGITQDYAQAAKWYRMAADQGFTKAESELGILYAKGFGVKQDYEEAYFWLSMSFDPFNADANKVMDQVKSYLSDEQQEIVQNRVNSWKPNKKHVSASANAGETNNESCAIRDLVSVLKLKKRAWPTCKDAYKDMKYICLGQGNSCGDCQKAFSNYDTTCNQQEEQDPAYACNQNTDCGLVDTNCNAPYDPVSVNRMFMMQEREKHSWPMEDCGRRLEVKQQYRPMCIKKECSIGGNDSGDQ